jgi:hypothetical protein
MMKKLVLIIVGFCGFCGLVSAQTVTNTRRLNELTASLKLAASANMQKQLRWPGKKDGHFLLQHAMAAKLF